jgi:3-oxoacyl-[acyl-carrier-protein] synthase II
MTIGRERRIAITGIGVVTPVGTGVEEFWRNLLAGVSGVDYAPVLMDSYSPWKIAGQVPDFKPEQWLGRKVIRRTDRFSQLALVSSMLAVENAGLDLEKENRERIGVAMGTAYAGWLFAVREMDVFRQKGLDSVNPHLGIAVFTGAAGGEVALHLGLKAPSLTISTGCDCSTACIAYSCDMIKHGDVDMMLAGGADAPVHPHIISALGISYALSNRNSEPQKASRPFDAKRDGFVMAEGGCMLVLEELEHARQRKARIYAELVGWGSSCDAHHMCQPAPDGAQASRALSTAMRRAGVLPSQVDYFNAHATSTQLGDKTETLVARTVFGEHASRIPTSSIKGAIGHMQGACGSSEVAACCMAMRDNILPPTLNYEFPDPDCDMDCIPNKPRYQQVDIAVSNSFSFGGRNTAVVMKRVPGGNHAAPAAVATSKPIMSEAA